MCVDNHKRKKLTLADAYKAYIANVEKGSVYDISQTEYSRICKKFNKKSMDFIIGGFGKMTLLSRLGEIEVRKSRKKTVNLRETIKKKETVYYINEHTNGYSMRFHWCKNLFISTAKMFYAFKATWSIKKQLNKFIEENPKLALSYNEANY